jgi:hypothetical protein
MAVVGAVRLLQQRLEGGRMPLLDVTQHHILLLAGQGGEAARLSGENLDPA